MYHNSVKPVQRSKGRSSVAAAAYRSGEKITDERTGIEHDYTRKSDVAYSALIGWNGTRAELWNAAEAAERRKDACTAREYEIGLPLELNQQQRQELAMRYGQWLHHEYGVAVDVCIHDKAGNPHAHVLTTTRNTTGDQLTEKSWREWSPQKRKAAGLEPRHVDIERARLQYAAMANTALEQAGAETRLDHRSYKRQKVEQLPTVHLGPAATAMERRGERTDKGDYNRAVTGINQTTAKIIDLQQARAERDAKRQQQQLEQWQQAERQQCRGLNSQKLRDRANTWRSAEAPPTPEMRKVQQQLEQLQRAGGWNDWSEEWHGGELRSNVYRAEQALELERQKAEQQLRQAGIGWLKQQTARVLPFMAPAKLREVEQQVEQAEQRLEQAREAWETAPDRATALEQRLEQLTGDWQRRWGERLEERTAKAELIERELVPPAVERETKAEAEEAAKQAREADRERRIAALAETMGRTTAPGRSLDLDALAKPQCGSEPEPDPKPTKPRSKDRGIGY